MSTLHCWYPDPDRLYVASIRDGASVVETEVIRSLMRSWMDDAVLINLSATKVARDWGTRMQRLSS